ncbi:MAG TPA: sigma 54-interacting transcriptional regulator [Blastocatellia bacterium]|jgi:DNA-binding NtrC family response regulator/tetratricopeptide (TPR) repeat protein|nr:sigma 54-interacting transcriptional regulator [Blastocatellia bacterium]
MSSQRVEEVIASGQSALDDSRFEEAEVRFRAALRMGPHTAEEEALIRCKLSSALEKRALNREQLEAVSKYDNFSDFVRLSERTQMLVLISLGWAHSVNNDIPRSIALFNQAITIARKLDDHAGMGACYSGLGRSYRFVSEIRIARDHYRSALEHFRQVGEWRELAECYSFIASIDGREGDTRNAVHSLKQALAIIGDRKEHDLLGRIYSDLALLTQNIDLIASKNRNYWEKGIYHFQKAGNKYMLAVIYNNFANQLLLLGEWDRGEEMSKTAIELLRGTTRFLNLGGALDTLAQFYVLRGRLDEADQLLQESMDAFETIKKKHPLNKELPLEASTQTTMGKSCLAKNQPEMAIPHLERSVDISMRSGDRQYLSDARIWLTETLLRLKQVGRARLVVETMRESLRESPEMLAWGQMMRLEAKLASQEGHLAAGIQALGQSTSLFQITGNVYDLAVNRVVLASMFELQGALPEAITEVKDAIVNFEKLGAAVAYRNAKSYLESLKWRLSVGGAESKAEGVGREIILQAHAQPKATSLASILDGFIAQRLVQASVSKELLLYEVVSIVRSQSGARGAVIYEVNQSDDTTWTQITGLEVAASVGVEEREHPDLKKLIMGLPTQAYSANFIYRLTDNQQSKFILKIVEPSSDRFVTGTVTMEPLINLVEQSLEINLLKSKNRRTGVFNPSRLLAEVELPGFICASRAMSRVLEQIHKIRSSDVTVLITGESGTGKELIARAVHAGSSRRPNTFLPFNCSAAPREMVESQLFGYRKGSFTGAIASNQGIIRAAERGTLFLDEIGDLPIELQPKLLRFLQEGEIHPIGESQPMKVDVRVVAATNSELERAVAEGRFREDLFHRLNVIRIQVPPLRERREEIPALVNHYLLQYQQEAAKMDIQMAEEALDLMVVYDWPGNVRQLCNEVRRLVAYSESGTIATPEALSPEIVRASREMPLISGTALVIQEQAQTMLPSGTLSEAIEEIERRMIQEALRKSEGNIARAAKDLGLSRKGLYLKINRFNFKI